MPDITVGAPEPGTYRYVVARYDWPRNQTYLIANYGESRKTRIVDWPKEWELPRNMGNPNHPTKNDRRVIMAFVQDRHLKDRVVRFHGWHDITEDWFKSLNHPDSGPTPGVPFLEALPGEVVASIT